MIRASSNRDRSAFIFPAGDPAIDFSGAKCIAVGFILRRERDSPHRRIVRLQMEIRRTGSEHWLVHWIVGRRSNLAPGESSARTHCLERGSFRLWSNDTQSRDGWRDLGA
jgi:hypothetical protein